jgi:hypothetical protein
MTPPNPCSQAAATPNLQRNWAVILIPSRAKDGGLTTQRQQSRGQFRLLAPLPDDPPPDACPPLSNQERSS